MLCVNTTYVASADPSEFQPLSMQPVEKLHDEFANPEIICQAAIPFASVATASIGGILHHEWNFVAFRICTMFESMSAPEARDWKTMGLQMLSKTRRSSPGTILVKSNRSNLPTRH